MAVIVIWLQIPYMNTPCSPRPSPKLCLSSVKKYDVASIKIVLP